MKSETALFQNAKNTIQSEAADTSQVDLLDDEQVIGMVTDRSKTATAPDMLQPSGKYTNASEAINDFHSARDTVLQYIHQTPIETMRTRISESPIGSFDGYQSLLFIAAHAARHTLQIDEVMAHKQFPEQ